jgi:NIMA (never in mitosis gene a)-related kinase
MACRLSKLFSLTARNNNNCRVEIMDNIDNYQRIKVVGKGTFGQAVLVKNKLDGLNYIMKQITVSAMSVKEKQESLNEVNVLSNLKHPNIVQYVTSFQSGNKLCIVMEYAEGGDLYEKIKNQRGRLFSETVSCLFSSYSYSLTVFQQILDWFIQICLSVKHCHDRRILHRDLKTQNIFLTKKNTIKLGDFGIARVLRNTMEHARTMVGTPYYLSPELCQERPYNNKSDVWSLGCVLYELTTLKHAFEGNDMKALIGKILRGIYPPISSQYSKDLRDVIDKCLQKDPRNRPSITSILNTPYVKKRMEQMVAQEPIDRGVLKPLAPQQENSRPSTAAANAQVKKEEPVKRGGIGLPFAQKAEPRDPVDVMKLERAKQHMEAMNRLKQAKERKAEVLSKPVANPVVSKQQFEVHVDQQHRDQYQQQQLQHQQKLKELEQQKRYQEEAMKRKQQEDYLRRKKEQEDVLKKQQEEALRKRKERELELQKRRQEEQAKRRELEKEAKRREEEILLQQRRKQQDEAYELRKLQQDAEQRRRAQEELDRKKAWENARLEAYKNRMKVQNGEKELPMPVENEIPARKQDQPKSRPAVTNQQNRREPKQDANKGAPAADPLAEYRKQQYWEARKQAELNRARAESQMNGVPEGSDPPEQQDDERQARESRLQKMKELEQKNKELENKKKQIEQKQKEEKMSYKDAVKSEPPPPLPVQDGTDEDREYKQLLRTMIGKLNEQQDKIEDCDDIFCGEGDEEPINQLGNFKLNGKTLRLKNVSEKDSLCYRIEALRAHLGEELGEDVFVRAYRLVDEAKQNDDDAVLEKRMIEILGSKSKQHYVPLIHQLVFCEDAQYAH